MVYAGKIGNDKVSLGVSGRLKDANLIMWDSETNSLWSQIKGEALHGSSKGKKLDMVPAIFVGLGTWTKMHPKTAVLDLSTVKAKPWYYTSDDLARGTVKARRRGTLTLGIGVRDAGEALAVSMPLLHGKAVINESVGSKRIAFVWHAEQKAGLVYNRIVNGKTLEFSLRGDSLHAGSKSWDAMTGKSHNKGQDLQRVPYLPTFLKPWKTYYPKGRVLTSE